MGICNTFGPLWQFSVTKGGGKWREEKLAESFFDIDTSSVAHNALINNKYTFQAF